MASFDGELKLRFLALGRIDCEQLSDELESELLSHSALTKRILCMVRGSDLLECKHGYFSQDLSGR